MKKLLMAISLFAASAVPAIAADDSWVQVRSPHFVVISDGGEKLARDVALGFEQIHDLFPVVLPALQTDSGAQTIVVAIKDKKTAKSILSFGGPVANPAGYLRRGVETQYAIVRLDATHQDQYAINRGCVREILSLNSSNMPRWLFEGLTEYFSNSTFEKNRALVGAPSDRAALLQKKGLTPIATFLKSTPNLNDDSQADMFYAESWALTHFLMSADGMQNGTLMNAYLRSFQQSADSVEAFRQAFGDPSALQEKFDTYVHQNAFRVLALNAAMDIDENSFSARQMSLAETSAILAILYARVLQQKLVPGMLAAALAQDPKLAIGYQNLALVDFWRAQNAQAKSEFDQALALDPNLYISLYYQTMMELNGKTDEESLAKMEQGLQAVLQLNPRFGPALVGLSKIYVRRGDLPRALDAAIRAKTYYPDQAGYLTNVAAIQLLQKDYANAIKTASFVAAVWSNTDSSPALAVVNEARRLGNISPTAEEQAQEAKKMNYAQRTVAVEGIVKSVTCDPKPLTLVLETDDGRDLLFQAGKSFGWGWADTLWFAPDYFDPCYHVTGARAVIRYKLPSNLNPDNSIHLLSSTDPTDIEIIEYRDELIPPSDPAPAN